jgi:hypothetical protein
VVVVDETEGDSGAERNDGRQRNGEHGGYYAALFSGRCHGVCTIPLTPSGV